ncbi:MULTISPECIES: lytic transglycosylase domain-containing protein [unclassified Cupriavidus]|uniref:lytic transglycosylase domain-containing protein n=1 Tax=unclassified Cupriavidus TaxID=2640874 RepID=UPI00040116E3|nr:MULTISPECIES: lytic transglycosylase domain-containing protein [unclassified Cupriavidus]MBP0632533.1 lytic transglycosylase domain-containing protein [Cupriavidus sp. AcVe19-1a]MBP0639353.1 lytic transglycosylase domain-containing protein [Cupriavidus sp. AcVe19-6a]
MTTRSPGKPWRKAAAAVLALAGLACAPAAHAELWGFIDADGVAHFADQKLDARYKLFMRDGGKLDSARLAALQRGKAQAGMGDADGIDLEQHKLYRYVVNHPNIKTVEPLIHQIADKQDVDPALVKAVMAVESGFNPGAVSPKGAIGLMQVIPDTGARFGVSADQRRTVEQKLADPRTNITAGVRYLRWLMQLFPNNLELVLAAYNAGEGAVQRYNNRIPPYPETQQYVSTVLQFYRFYQPSQSARGARPMRASAAADGPRVKMVLGGRRDMP